MNANVGSKRFIEGLRTPMTLRMTSRRGQYYRCRSSVHEVLNLGLNTLEGAIMKIFHAAFAALLITGSMFLPPAHAQSAPQESYRTSCTDARVEDRTVCRFADGREQRTSLTDVNRCVGDTADNGARTCSHGQPMAPYRQDRR